MPATTRAPFAAPAVDLMRAPSPMSPAGLTARGFSQSMGTPRSLPIAMQQGSVGFGLVAGRMTSQKHSVSTGRLADVHSGFIHVDSGARAPSPGPRAAHGWSQPFAAPAGGASTPGAPNYTPSLTPIPVPHQKVDAHSVTNVENLPHGSFMPRRDMSPAGIMQSHSYTPLTGLAGALGRGPREVLGDRSNVVQPMADYGHKVEQFQKPMHLIASPARLTRDVSNRHFVEVVASPGNLARDVSVRHIMEQQMRSPSPSPSAKGMTVSRTASATLLSPGALHRSQQQLIVVASPQRSRSPATSPSASSRCYAAMARVASPSPHRSQSPPAVASRLTYLDSSAPASSRARQVPVDVMPQHSLSPVASRFGFGSASADSIAIVARTADSLVPPGRSTPIGGSGRSYAVQVQLPVATNAHHTSLAQPSPPPPPLASPPRRTVDRLKVKGKSLGKDVARQMSADVPPAESLEKRCLAGESFNVEAPPCLEETERAGATRRCLPRDEPPKDRGRSDTRPSQQETDSLLLELKASKQAEIKATTDLHAMQLELEKQRQLNQAIDFKPVAVASTSAAPLVALAAVDQSSAAAVASRTTNEFAQSTVATPVVTPVAAPVAEVIADAAASSIEALQPVEPEGVMGSANNEDSASANGESRPSRPGKPPGPPPSGRRPGKAPGPPPPSRPDRGAKGGSKGSAGVRCQSAAAAPLGVRLYARQCYRASNHTTVFDDTTGAEMAFIENLVRKQKPQRPSPTSTPERRFGGGGVCIFDTRRALGVELAMGQLRITVTELSSRLRSLDLGDSKLSADSLEKLIGKMPSEEESQALLEYFDCPEKLRVVERQMLPLCSVDNAERRLTLLHLKASHSAKHEEVRERLSMMSKAAQEVLENARLHNIFRSALGVMNCINGETARAFPASSFETFAKFKIGEVPVVECLCQMLKLNSVRVRELKKELEFVHQASRGSMADIRKEIRTFEGYVAEAKKHLAVERNSDARERTESLMEALSIELASLAALEAEARKRVAQAQCFLGEREGSLPPAEEFFGYLVQLLKQLGEASESVADNLPPEAAQEASEQLKPISPTDRTRRVSFIADGYNVQAAVVTWNETP